MTYALGDWMREARAKAHQEALNLRGQPPPQPVAAGYTITITCPTCGGPLCRPRRTRVGARRTEATWQCPACGTTWRATVSLADLGRRWSFAAIEAHEHATVHELAERWHMPRNLLYRWKADGLDDYRADELAIRCGTHPAVLWAGWLDHPVQLGFDDQLPDGEADGA